DRLEFHAFPLRQMDLHEIVADVQEQVMLAAVPESSGDNLRRLPRSPERAREDSVYALGQKMAARPGGGCYALFSHNRLVTPPLISMLQVKGALSMPDDQPPGSLKLRRHTSPPHPSKRRSAGRRLWRTRRPEPSTPHGSRSR